MDACYMLLVASLIQTLQDFIAQEIGKGIQVFSVITWLRVHVQIPLLCAKLDEHILIFPYSMGKKWILEYISVKTTFS